MKSNNKNKEIGLRDWIDKLPIYQTCMDSEQSIRIGYQSLLITLEAAIFGLFFVLVQLEWIKHLWILPMTGILLCFIFGIACEFRARNYDFWRKCIINLVKGTDLEDDFKGGKYGHPDEWHPLFDKKSRFGKLGVLGDKFFGHWLERVLVPCMILAWLVILILFL
jgi:hypothetical protein